MRLSKLLLKFLQMELMTFKNYIDSLPSFVRKLIMINQEQQGNSRDICVFYKHMDETACKNGFDWVKTKEGYDIWINILGIECYGLWEGNEEFSPDTTETIEKLKEMYPHLAKPPVNIFV